MEAKSVAPSPQAPTVPGGAPQAAAPSAAHARDLVIYDDACPMCTFQVRVLTRLDWGERLEVLGLSSPLVQRIAPQLKREDLQAAIHVLTRKGALHRAARGIRYVSGRLPLLWPLFILLWIPGVIYLAEFVYRLVARNRLTLSKWFGCKGACALLPEKKRAEAPPRP